MVEWVGWLFFTMVWWFCVQKRDKVCLQYLLGHRNRLGQLILKRCCPCYCFKHRKTKLTMQAIKVYTCVTQSSKYEKTWVCNAWIYKDVNICYFFSLVAYHILSYYRQILWKLLCEVTAWESTIKGMQQGPAGSTASCNRTISYQPHAHLLPFETSLSVADGLGRIDGRCCGCHPMRSAAAWCGL